MVLLDVPYFVQPTPITCQSTCLKMMATYLARRSGISHPAEATPIQEIWATINTGTARPVRQRNSYENMRWWLQQAFPHLKFEVARETKQAEGILRLKSKIDRDYPALVSTNHSRTKGHIILVIGYADPPGATSGETLFACHDPYGKFDPQLFSGEYGKRRFEGGQSLGTGGESGPGKAVWYNYEGVRRSRSDRHSTGSLYVISVA